MALTVLTLWSFSGYYLKGINCWECNFSLNFFSKNILWRFYPGNISFLICHLTLYDFMRNMWLHGCIRLIINHQLAKFHGHRPCQRGYVTLLVYHITTHHQIFWGSCDSIGGFLSLQVPNLPGLVVIDLAEGELVSFQFIT